MAPPASTRLLVRVGMLRITHVVALPELTINTILTVISHNTPTFR